jgi:enoyl-CoA hydratase/carnithine racemase
MSGPRTIRYSVADGVGRIVLDRPERGNGLTPLLLHELETTVERADLDPAVRVLVLSGAGSGFCGGYDLVESAEPRAPKRSSVGWRSRRRPPRSWTRGSTRSRCGSRACRPTSSR